MTAVPDRKKFPASICEMGGYCEWLNDGSCAKCGTIQSWDDRL